MYVDLKVVPGASRDALAGPLAGRLKVRVGAPPEGGKANKRVLALLAARLGLSARDLEIVSGHTRPQKTVAIRGMGVEAVGRLLYDEAG